jgi:aminoglycoside phosphotransferase (APT) family kinase protein
VSSTEETSPRPRTSSRDRDEQRRRLTLWLAERINDPQVSELVAPPTTGMSSETLLFDVSWTEDGAERRASWVARVAPDVSDVPVFPSYDMERQFRLMQLVERCTSVPVPPTRWYEPDPGHLGAPFFVMERVEGQVPPDLMPYTFGDNWFYDADPADQRRLQDASVDVLAQLHAIKMADLAGVVDGPPAGGSALRAHVSSLQGYYEWVVAGHERSPLIERGFAWLEDHWPADEGPTVLSWGDSRVGNMMYRDFLPVAVLDWEMADVGPAEIDLSWMMFLHRFFQDMTEQAGLPGLPEFMRIADAASTYERRSGHTPRDLDFYLLYSALRHAVVMTRVTWRQIHFGESVRPDDPDDLIIHRPTLEAMLAGTYHPA